MLHSIARSNLLATFLFAGAILSLAGSRWLLDAARDRADWSATKGYLEVIQAPRITAHPGVTAWLAQLLRQQCEAEPGADAQADCVNLLRPGPLPTRLQSLQLFLEPSQPASQAATLLESRKAGRLCIAEFELNGHRYAASRPALDSDCKVPAGDPLIQQAIAALDARPIPPRMLVEPFGGIEPVRAYIVAQDGSLISRRFLDQQLQPQTRSKEYLEHTRAAETGNLPAITAVNSFFPLTRNAGYAYTGTYMDVSGLGVVATGMTGVTLDGLGDAVIAIDIALGTDWVEKLMLDRPRLLPLDMPMDGSSAASWKWVATQASRKGADQLAKLVMQCAGFQRTFDTVATCVPNDDPQGGLLTATFIGLSNSGTPGARWLIAWMPPLQTSFELAQYLPAVLLTLAALAYVMARRESRQWQQVIDSMGAALTVIDPNTDRVLSRNAVAQQHGIELDTIFRNHVYADDQAVYDQANLAMGSHQRSYAVRLSPNAATPRWAIVHSSTSQTALPMQGTRRGDRLGTVMLLAEQEIQVLRTSLRRDEVIEERQILAALIGHGIAHLTRLMENESALEEGIRHWLRKYLVRRVQVLKDVLSGWQLLEETELNERIVAKAKVRSTLEMFSAVAALAAQDLDLRSDLGWDNGSLSNLASGVPPFAIDLQDWPDDVYMKTQLEDAELFIFDELLINTFKHGAPGRPSMLRARVITSAGSLWIEFELSNERSSTTSSGHHLYGGQQLVQEVCRRLRWEWECNAQQDDAVYVVRWRARAIKN